MARPRVSVVVGARPNLMKAAALLEAAQQAGAFETTLIHTGQHYDDEMSGAFFRDLSIQRPDVELGVGPGSPVSQTARIMLALEPVLTRQQPQCVVVVGDVTSTLAAALVGSKLSLPVAHVEAGLRSFDRSMPEEINRTLTDAISEYLFTSSPEAETNLAREGIPSSRVFFVGNVMIDTLLRHVPSVAQLDMPNRHGVEPGNYAVLTLHRPSNVDSSDSLHDIVKAIGEIQSRMPLIFPSHPRTMQRLVERGLDQQLRQMRAVKVTGPLGYLEFLGLMARARVVLTDSGGVQEETTVLGVPCLTLRENTERPITISHGTNTLVGTRTNDIMAAFEKAVRNGCRTASRPPLWDGHAAARITRILAEKLS